VRPSLAYVTPLLAEPDRPAALYALSLIDVETLMATPHNVGVLYLSHEVQQPRFDTFRAHRDELASAYKRLVGGLVEDPQFIGACCMQLVEMVITLRRDGEPGASTAPAIATACLRLLGLPEDEVARGVVAGEALLAALTD